jgi:hypothetical protein
MVISRTVKRVAQLMEGLLEKHFLSVINRQNANIECIMLILLVLLASNIIGRIGTLLFTMPVSTEKTIQNVYALARKNTTINVKPIF